MVVIGFIILVIHGGYDWFHVTENDILWLVGDRMVMVFVHVL